MPGATASTSAQNGDSSTTPETAPTSPGGERGCRVWSLRPPNRAETVRADRLGIVCEWIDERTGMLLFRYPRLPPETRKLVKVAPGKYERR